MSRMKCMGLVFLVNIFSLVNRKFNYQKKTRQITMLKSRLYLGIHMTSLDCNIEVMKTSQITCFTILLASSILPVAKRPAPHEGAQFCIGSTFLYFQAPINCQSIYN